MVINNEFNKLQINEVIDKDANGNVLKRSLMLNIRCNDVEEADDLYRQLKTKFNGSAASQNGGKNGTSGGSASSSGTEWPGSWASWGVDSSSQFSFGFTIVGFDSRDS